LKEELGDQIAVGYRHFPLSFHPFAQKAGEASECVAKLSDDEGFWKYADYVFTENEKQQGINDAVITAGAEAAGVNINQFKTCLDSGEMAEKISADMNTGVAAGINGTPGTVIITEDGAQEIIVGALPYEQVKATVEKYL
jgi:protein-disulfide isomerase